jgi:hypothetical protein
LQGLTWREAQAETMWTKGFAPFVDLMSAGTVLPLICDMVRQTQRREKAR